MASLISALPIGDKLALKGKLFELQKKLNIIELENQSKEEFTFQPEIIDFELPDRDRSFDENVRRAELIRKQKMDMLKETLGAMSSAACTFSPRISERSQRLVDSEYLSRNAFHRLHEKAVESRRARDDLIARSKKFDSEGNRLFSPTIPKARRQRSAPPPPPSSPPASASTSFVALAESEASQVPISATPRGNSISVGEFMYRDAVDREQRHKMRLKKAKVEAQRGASSHQNNKRSVEILRRKAEREVRAVFELLDVKHAAALEYGDLQEGVELMCQRGKLPSELLYKTTEQAWSILDADKLGHIKFPAFLHTCIPFMLRETATGSWVAENSLPSAATSKTLTTASQSFLHPPVNAVPKNQELTALRTVIRTLINILKESPDLVGAKNISMQPSFRGKHAVEQEAERGVFSPVISVKSQRLAMNNRKALVQKEDGATAAASPGLDSVTESAVSSPQRTPSGIDLIPRRMKKKQDDLDKLKEEKEQEEQKRCTFRPLLIGGGRRGGGGKSEQGQGSDAQPAFERLYALKDIQIRAKSSAELKSDAKAYRVPYVRKEDTEMDECTFAPAAAVSTRISDELAQFLGKSIGTEMSRAEGSREINAYIRSKNLQDQNDGRKIHPDVKLCILLKIQPGEELTYFSLQHYLGHHFAKPDDRAPPLPPEGEYAAGFHKSVDRVRAHRSHLMREPERRLAELAACDARYFKGRELLLAKGLNPPSFLTDDRVLKKKQQRDRKIEPRLYVDVKLSNTKTACIPILDDDNPAAIAKSFCRIYALDITAQGILEEVVRQSMEINEVRISEPVAGMDGPSPLKISTKNKELRRNSVLDEEEEEEDASDEDMGSTGEESTGSSDSGSDDSGDDDADEGDGEEGEEEAADGGTGGK